MKRRLAFLLISGSVVACAGAPPPATPKPSKVVVAEKKPEPEPAPAPALLPSERVQLTQKSDFLRLELGTIRPKLMSEEDLLGRLSAAAKIEIRAIERAQKAADAAGVEVGTASLNLDACDGCPQHKALAAKQEQAYDKHDRALRALTRARVKAETALEKMLARPAASPAVGLALARLQSGSSLEPSSPSTLVYGEPKASVTGEEALLRAIELAKPGEELGQRARQELLHLWASGRGDRQQKIIDELLAAGPSEWRSELHFRSALGRAEQGDDRGALERFENSLKEHTAASAVSRETILTGILIARYRLLDFEGTLAAASALFEEWATPSVPDSSSAGQLGILASMSSRLNARLSSSAVEAAVTRFAADAVERLDRDPTALEGRSDLRASVLSRLAVRALYRSDTAGARRLAEAAVGPEPLAEAEDALRVLELVARREGDEARAAELVEKRESLRGRFVGMSGLLGGSLDEPDRTAVVEELRERVTPDARKSKTKSKNDDEPEPPAKRVLRSALRLCIEPVRERLPKATAADKKRSIATVSLNAKVFDDGHSTVEADADNRQDGMASVLECLKGVAPRVLARAPSSISAKVVIDDSARRAHEFGSNFGLGSVSASGGVWGSLSGVGAASGYGGLGLVGTGSGGGGTGVGSIGIGRLGGLGTKGRGSGYGAKKRPKKPAIKPKPPAAPK